MYIYAFVPRNIQTVREKYRKQFVRTTRLVFVYYGTEKKRFNTGGGPLTDVFGSGFFRFPENSGGEHERASAAIHSHPSPLRLSSARAKSKRRLEMIASYSRRHDERVRLYSPKINNEGKKKHERSSRHSRLLYIYILE